MAFLKYFFYLCLIIAPTQASPALAVLNDSKVDLSATNLKIAPGQNVSVTCTPGGSPLPQVRWKKYGGEFGKGTSQSGNTLTISNALRSDTGHYMCTGEVDRKVAMQKFVYVEVKEEERPKSVKVSPRLLTIWWGQNASIDCIPQGSPLPTVQWRKGEGRLSNRARQEDNKLIITSAQAEDSGDYVCHAIRESTTVYEDFARIVVQGGPPVTRPPVTRPPVTRPPQVPQQQIQNAGSPRVTVSVKQIRIPRGGSRSVECKPEGIPLPRVQWTKAEGGLGKGTYQSGNALVITDAQDHDHGDYVCTAVVQGTPVTTDYLQVEIVGNEATPYRPDQLPRPLDVNLDEGKDIRISCDFETGDDQQIITWSRLDRRPFPRNIQQSSRELIFQRVSKHNEGEYLCKVTGGGFLLRQLYVRLTVNAVQRQTVQPRVAIRPETSNVVRGQTQSLECVVIAGDDVRTAWERVGGEFSSRVENRGPQLVFRNIEVEDAGSYRCIARNDVGETAVTTQIVVTDDRQQSPTVDVNTQRLRIPRGGSGSIVCNPKGYPLPTIQWSKGNGDFSRTVRQEGNALVITNAQDVDAGDYVCNGLVESTSVWPAYVQIEIVENVPPPTPPPSQGSSRVVVSETQVKIPRGGSKTVECIPEGSPLPRPQWIKVFKETGRFGNGVKQEGNSLVITNAQVSDSDNYRCTAVVQGTSVYDAYLQVIVEDVPPPKPPPSQGSPRVVVSETQVKIPKGGSKTVECIPEGSPLPRPQWIKAAGRFGDGVRQKGNSLVITNAQASDSDNYRCAAVVQGTSVYDAYVQVIVEDVLPLPPTPPPSQGSPRVEVSETQVKIPRGGSKTVECIPEGSPLPRPQWIKETGRFGDGVRQEGNSLVITNAQVSDSDNYRCAAVVQGTSVYDAYLQVIVEDVPPPTPPPSQGSPRVEVSETQVKIPRGGSKTVECIPEGYPLPRPQWIKETGRFGDGVRQEGNSLVITNAQDSDSDNYRCAAVVQGTSVYDAYLQVIVEDEPAIEQNQQSIQNGSPKVRVSQSSLEISRGDSKTIECTPEGYPLPTVRWTKESGEFASETRQDGNALVITNAEEDVRGNYICSAVVDGVVAHADYLTVEVNSSVNNIDKSICQLPSESKLCWGSNYYYDINEHKCTSYSWGTCSSNANNFESEEACNLACDGV